MAVQALTRDTMPKGEGDLSIEGHGMEPIPEAARYGAVWRALHGVVHAEPGPRRVRHRRPRPDLSASASSTGCWRSSSATSSGPPWWAS